MCNLWHQSRLLIYLLPRRTCWGNRRRTRYRRVPVHLHHQQRQEEVQRDRRHPQEQPENVKKNKGDSLVLTYYYSQYCKASQEIGLNVYSLFDLNRVHYSKYLRFKKVHLRLINLCFVQSLFFNLKVFFTALSYILRSGAKKISTLALDISP